MVQNLYKYNIVIKLIKHANKNIIDYFAEGGSSR